MQFPITIGLRRSRILGAAVLAAVLLATVVLLAYPGQAWLVFALLVAAWGLALRAWLSLKPEITALRIERAGQIFVVRAGEAEFISVEAEPGATVHPWLTAIRLRSEDGRRSWLLATVDSANREDLRRLRSCLRWQSTFSDADGDA